PGQSDESSINSVIPPSTGYVNRSTSVSLEPQVEFPHQLIVVELFGVAAFEGDLAVHDDIAAIGDAYRLVEVLFGHQHGQLEPFLQFLDLVDRAADQDRREPDRGLVDQ